MMLATPLRLCTCPRSVPSAHEPAARPLVGVVGTLPQGQAQSRSCLDGRIFHRHVSTVVRVTDAEYGMDLSVAEDSYVVLVRVRGLSRQL